MPHMPKMKTVRISRKRWCRGNKNENSALSTQTSALRTQTGQSCCLGFVCRAFGIRTPKDVLNISELPEGTPFERLPKQLRPIFNLAGMKDSPLHEELVTVNDSDEVVGKEREKKIRDLLAKANVRVVFVD